MRKINIVLGFCAVVAASSCSKKLDLAPVSSISDANYWQTPDQVDAFVSGLHTRLRSSTGQIQYLGEMRADIFGTDPGSSSTFTGEATQGVERLWTNNLDLDNPGVSNYGGFYANIAQLNLLIDKLNTTNIVTQANKNYYLGIAYGMRAYSYFHIYRSWGKAVIQTEPTTSFDIANLAKAASPEADVLALVKDDVEKSLAAFGTDYSFRNQKGYWSKAATLMLKAEINLWTSYRGGGTADATTAKNVLTDIQANVAGLALLPSFANVFASANYGNAEMIFAIRNKLNEAQLPFAGTFFPQTSLIVNYYDSVGNRKFNVTTDNWGGLLRAPIMISTFRKFSDLDSRKWASIVAAYNLSGGSYKIAGAFVGKYQGEQLSGARQYTNDFPVYRYADLLLMLAEAKVILGESPATEINAVRQRAYGTNYNATTMGYPNQSVDADAKESILQERYFEFVFEGKRWYDLRRMDASNAYVYKYTNILPADSYKVLWPVDRNTLTNNRALTQTPGYAQF
ncbi:SusD family outer membrane lipoprotein NanU [Pinibacter aurantiacus]|uniref:SusD family outer membrane lipoprotein NanU n=1 Tax=Pinibacter aurantiacus TaxID=2851599 RepID=A0A9E2W2L8_9BACT|nr:SusD family outer membrane lipoprotein NanU [Pinibacter aurantiacus]MBV4355939.1 SusD family outer membrane lipoprotein NanU [Pinibacter aurantiacus]